MIKIIIYIFMALIGFIAIYSIFNAGNPESLIRIIFPDPRTDVYIAFISSFIIFVLGFFVFYSKDQTNFKNLLEINQDKIRSLRKNGTTDNDIADSILKAMGKSSGYSYNIAKKKLMIVLSETD